MKNSKQLINNIIGQLGGVSRMIEEGKDCSDVIVQLKAIKSATNTLANRYIEENAVSCLSGKDSVTMRDKKKIKDLISELVKNN